MQMLAPLGPVYQAGTLSGNPLAMAAGIATVSELIRERETVYPKIGETTRQVAVGIAQAAHKAGVPMTVNWIGSMVTWFFGTERVVDFTTAAASDLKRFGRFHRAMLERGVWLPPSQFEAAFIGAAHGEAEINATIAAAEESLQEIV